MFKKSFISLYFLPEKLLLLQLSSNKKKVVKSAQVVLPKDLIKNYKVQDTHALAKILKIIWSKFNISEKSVGIVLPEFSTFTKYFKIPALSATELDEAVRWQAQEYLPASSEELILDWKIIKGGTGTFEVLIVSVAKDVLKGYVESAEEAGLFPLLVETPSICLTRFNKEPSLGYLVVYQSLEESLLIIAEGEKIVGSSVQTSKQVEGIVGAATKMLAHYKEVKVSKIYVAGPEAKQEIIDKFIEATRVKVEKIEPKIEGLKDEEIQGYLIPVSMQFQDPMSPPDPSTINLLPTDLVEKYKHERLKLQVWSLSLTVTLFVWISFLLTIGAYLFMVQQINDLKSKNESKKEISIQREKIVSDIESINNTANKVLKIKEISFLPQQILNDIYSAKPSDVIINSYQMDLDKGQITLSGGAVDRNSLIEFKQNLEANEDIVSVQIPISNFEAETNLSFNLTFNFKPIYSKVKDSKTNR